jgi:hypothetical protein
VRAPIGAVVLLVGAAVLAACTSDAVCPAIGYSTVVTIALDEAWPDRDELELDVQCAPDASAYDACRPSEASSGPEWTGTATSPPNTVEVTVRRGTVVVAQETVGLDVRVVEYPNGRGCGGPTAADAILPPPG